FLMIGATFWGDEDKRVFSSFCDVFNPYSGRAQHPAKVQQWQERVQGLRNDQIQQVNAEFEERMTQLGADIDQLTREKEQRLYDIKTTLPEGVRPEEHSLW